MLVALRKPCFFSRQLADCATPRNPYRNNYHNNPLEDRALGCLKQLLTYHGIQTSLKLQIRDLTAIQLC
ncbi:unnamed protein product [Victoria cruziana]